MLIQLAQSQTGWPTLIQVCWGKHWYHIYNAIDDAYNHEKGLTMHVIGRLL